MAATFEQKRLQVAELCGRVERAQARVNSDVTSITELRVAMRGAEAKEARHEVKLRQLKTKLTVAGASLSEREGSEATKPVNLVSSDEEDIKEVDISATIDDDEIMRTPEPIIQRNSGNRDRTAKRRSTLVKSFETIHEDFPTVVMIDGQCVRGFCRHYNRGHGGLAPRKGAVHVYCTLRAISDVNVALLKAGQLARDSPIQKVDHPDNTPAPTGSNDAGSVTPQLRGLREKSTKSIHPDFPTVIEVDDVWDELTCKDCGANAVRDGSEFMQSEIAFRAHAKRTHDAITNAGLGGYCNMRSVSARDTDLMKASQDPVDHQIERMGYFEIAARAARVPRSDTGLRSHPSRSTPATSISLAAGRAKTAPPSEKKPTFGDLFGYDDVSDSDSA
ncbi:hypothetical protein B0A48_09223 [Cryoendolithus antarcticus]|uniref:Uncharacterized protein n=1 Tax=Cryoendolithus antarcticus TaxID=1507870 RepID=A0A1V8T2C9_9PEZI|nr:hypothetical protein B0A48_09223 [Cryoendolithus antarcticus]